MAAEVKFKIIEHIGVLSINEKSKWQKEVNVISWNDGTAKHDIRDWGPDHEKAGKGVTLTSEEWLKLKELQGGNHE